MRIEKLRGSLPQTVQLVTKGNRVDQNTNLDFSLSRISGSDAHVRLSQAHL